MIYFGCNWGCQDALSELLLLAEYFHMACALVKPTPTLGPQRALLARYGSMLQFILMINPGCCYVAEY